MSAEGYDPIADEPRLNRVREMLAPLSPQLRCPPTGPRSLLARHNTPRTVKVRTARKLITIADRLLQTTYFRTLLAWTREPPLMQEMEQPLPNETAEVREMLSTPFARPVNPRLLLLYEIYRSQMSRDKEYMTRYVATSYLLTEVLCSNAWIGGAFHLHVDAEPSPERTPRILSALHAIFRRRVAQSSVKGVEIAFAATPTLVHFCVPILDMVTALRPVELTVTDGDPVIPRLWHRANHRDVDPRTVDLSAVTPMAAPLPDSIRTLVVSGSSLLGHMLATYANFGGAMIREYISDSTVHNADPAHAIALMARLWRQSRTPPVKLNMLYSRQNRGGYTPPAPVPIPPPEILATVEDLTAMFLGCPDPAPFFMHSPNLRCLRLAIPTDETAGLQRVVDALRSTQKIRRFPLTLLLGNATSNPQLEIVLRAVADGGITLHTVGNQSVSCEAMSMSATLENAVARAIAADTPLRELYIEPRATEPRFLKRAEILGPALAANTHLTTLSIPMPASVPIFASLLNHLERNAALRRIGTICPGMIVNDAGSVDMGDDDERTASLSGESDGNEDGDGDGKSSAAHAPELPFGRMVEAFNLRRRQELADWTTWVIIRRNIMATQERLLEGWKPPERTDAISPALRRCELARAKRAASSEGVRRARRAMADNELPEPAGRRAMQGRDEELRAPITRLPLRPLNLVLAFVSLGIRHGIRLIDPVNDQARFDSLCIDGDEWD